MEVNFGEDQTPVAPEQKQETAPVTQTTPPPTGETADIPAAPVASGTTALATTSSPGLPAGPSGLVLGDKIPDFGDIILPRINISQNIGQLKDTFAPGSVILGRSVVLYTPPVSAKIDPRTGNVTQVAAPASPPCVITVMGFRPTRYAEKVSGGERGIIVDTEDEVRAAGGTLDYKEYLLKQKAGMKRFEPLADALVAVQQTEGSADDGTVFVYEVDGRKYALALWAMRGTAYTSAAKRVFFTARAVGCLRGGYPTYCYSLAAREETYPSGNKAWVPVCIALRRNSEAFMEFVKSVLGAA